MESKFNSEVESSPESHHESDKEQPVVPRFSFHRLQRAHYMLRETEERRGVPSLPEQLKCSGHTALLGCNGQIKKFTSLSFAVLSHFSNFI